MDNGRKISSKYIVALIFAVFVSLQTWSGWANYSAGRQIGKILTLCQDTVPATRDSSKIPVARDSRLRSVPAPDTGIRDYNAKDTSNQKADSFQIKVSKDSLDAPINYSASDSIIMEIPSHTVTLYNKSEIKYKDITLQASKIIVDQPKQVVVASYTLDTSDQEAGKPKMIQAQTAMESDSIIYNLKTLKGITKNTFTQSGEIYLHGEKMKKISENEYFALRGRFTTCQYDPPHFAFIANKMELINKKYAITGPVHLEVEEVPIPIYLPFGFFPLIEGRHSGLLPPTFAESPSFGLGLTGLGYYKVFSDNLDLIAKSDLYSYGGWNLYLTPEYRVRYRYSGRINFTYQDTRSLSASGQSAFDQARTFQFSWSHTVDSKARPGTNFSANVNVSSQKFNQYVYTNPTANYTNQLSSSINYSKTWDGKYNLNLSATHSQNNETGIIQMNLPNLAFTAVTLYPFQKKEFIGAPKWYEKLGVGLTTSFTNQATLFDSTFSFRRLIDTFQWGASHTIPITLSLPPLFSNALQISPGISLAEKWYSKKIFRSWDNVRQKLDTSFQKGFFVANDVSFSINLATALYGTFTHFGQNSSILGIRHVLRPTLGLSYTPNLNGKYYYTSRADSAGNTFRFSQFDGSSYGPFAEGTFGGINFGLDNNLEMKVKSSTDTVNGGTKKVKLIDGFGVTSGYNYLADSFKLSPFTFYLRSTLFGTINITGGATLDPYITDSFGFRKNIYAWANPGHKFSVGRLTTGNLAISTKFQSKPKDQKKAEDQKKEEEDQIPLTPEEQQEELNYIRSNPAQFADFNIAWSINLSFSLSFSKVIKPDYSGYSTLINSGLNWNGDFNLSPKWKVGLNSFYDVKNEKTQSLTMFLSRDLHCWQMSINVTPVGLYRSFSVTISPKSGILQDLKINRTRTFAD